jgi:hypothetical protein
MLTTFTSYDQVRALLALEDKELRDDTLSLPIYSTLAEEALHALGTTVLDRYGEILALATKSRTQARLSRLVDLFVTYAIADELTRTLPLLAQQQVTDGRAQTSRFTFQPEVIANIKAGYAGVRYRLLLVFKELYPNDTLLVTSSSTDFVAALTTSAVGLSADPVTS